jgi:hypothetical protein
LAPASSFPKTKTFKKERESLYAERRLSGRDEGKWQDAGKKIRESLGVSEEEPKYADSHNMDGVKATPRVKDFLSNIYFNAVKKNFDVDGIVVDYSETIDRALRSKKQDRRTITTVISRNSEFLFFKLGRALVSEEIAAVMGFGAPAISADVNKALRQLKENEARDLICNAMVCGHIGIILVAVAVNLPGVFSKKK